MAVPAPQGLETLPSGLTWVALSMARQEVRGPRAERTTRSQQDTPSLDRASGGRPDWEQRPSLLGIP